MKFREYTLSAIAFVFCMTVGISVSIARENIVPLEEYDSSFVAAADVAQVKKAVLRSALRRRWLVVSDTDTSVRLRFEFERKRRGRQEAVIDVLFSAAGLGIKHVSSSGMLETKEENGRRMISTYYNSLVARLVRDINIHLLDAGVTLATPVPKGSESDGKDDAESSK
jgi:hypothetical protein